MKLTRSIKKGELNQKWYLIDADGVRLGKLATKCASLLQGKHKVDQTDNLVSGDQVVIINADKVDVHIKKLTQKTYYKHSGYIGGLKEKGLDEMLKDQPEKVIEIAVKGMLPKTKIGRKLFKNLHVVSGENHNHEAQKPTKIEVK